MTPLIIFAANYFIIFVGVGWLITFVWLERQKKIDLLLLTLVAGVIALILSRIAGQLYFDPRPFVTLHVAPLIAHTPDNGFPSDHALLSMVLTGVAYYFNKKIALAMLVLSVLIGTARVAALVHSPLDIIFGWVIALVAVGVSYYLIQFLTPYLRHEHF